MISFDRAVQFDLGLVRDLARFLGRRMGVRMKAFRRMRIFTLTFIVVVSGGVLAPSAVAASGGEPTSNAVSSSFSCIDLNHEVVGGGMMVTSVTTVGNRTFGSVHFFADNGQHRKYSEEYTVGPNGGGGDAVGSIVTAAGPQFGNNWLYIVGTASYAPSGSLASYSGSAVDICADLGYPATL